MKTLEEIKIETAKEMNYPQRVDLYIDEVAKRFSDQQLAEYKREIHNKIVVAWEKDFGSIHNDQTMDAYTVSGFIKSALL